MIALLLLSFGFNLAHAIPETQLNTEFVTVLEPFYSSGHAFAFTGERGVVLQARSFMRHESHLGTVVVVTGYSENMHKYVEVAYDLFRRGYSVFLFDHRGQGSSQRLLPDKKEAHIDTFSALVNDLHTYFKDYVQREATGPYFLLAHSLGGLVGARELEVYPRDFAAAVLSAPMLSVDLHGAWPRMTKLALDFLSLIGLDKFYIRQAGDPAADDFASNQVTHSAARFAVLNTGISRAEPETTVWGLSARWLEQSLNAGQIALREALTVNVPVLLFQAGEDSFVRPEGEEKFCAQAAHCELKKFPDSRHEILMEEDPIRDQAMAAINDFYRRK